MASRSAVENGYDHAFIRVFLQLGETVASLDRQRRSAPGLASELLALPPAARTLLIRNASGFQTWALAEFLLSRARAAWRDDAAGAEELASLALSVARELDASDSRGPVVHDLQARCWSYLANAQRIGSEPQRAEEAFRRAEELLDQGTGDPLERARLLELQATLDRDCRRLDQAARRLDLAARTYRRVGETMLAARIASKRALIHRETGHAEKGVTVLLEAMRHVGQLSEPRLLLSLQHNLILCLNEAGRSREAQARLPAVRELALSLGNRLDLLRVRWLDGLVAANLEQDTRAEWSFRAAREGFLRLGIAYDVAMVSLDLAAFFLSRGRTDETRRLAGEIIPLLSARDVHREILAAMLLFAEAAERDALTLGLLGEIGVRVKGSAGDGQARD